MPRTRPKPQVTIQSVTRQIVGDSLEKRKLVAKLVQLVREDERRKASQ